MGQYRRCACEETFGYEQYSSTKLAAQPLKRVNPMGGAGPGPGLGQGSGLGPGVGWWRWGGEGGGKEEGGELGIRKGEELMSTKNDYRPQNEMESSVCKYFT